MDNHILPECYLDTMLTEILVKPVFGYNHQKGCSTVTSKMQNCKNLKDNFAVGILDNDKKQTPYLNELNLISEKFGLKLYKHPYKHHYLILHPPIEQWLLDEANAANIDLNNYQLPGELSALKKQTKTAASKHDQQFKNLFRDLKTRESFSCLSNWLSYLKQHPYDACLEHLQHL
ncbi:hypothetical protein QLH52_11215 [Methylomonas sp. OY6]|uniref:Uncharacterized protein n=1 Tax=Methylomonas defluvii TaxID=3045149 RepID=A0ABU4UEJ3_9GAMM|nr:hypothetical protein [Methylomonas sp. OY6]MDX8127852.1 hypothetical protein [Methylomonas sp. OY6]